MRDEPAPQTDPAPRPARCEPNHPVGFLNAVCAGNRVAHQAANTRG